MSNQSQSTVTVLTYNLRFHIAYEEAFEIAHRYNIDIVCLQECYKELLPSQEGEFSLADKTTNSFLSLAVYYRTSRFKVLSTTPVTLSASFYERCKSQESERMVVARLYDIRQKKELLVASFHAIHLVASNYQRRIQVREALLHLNEYSSPANDIPAIIAGDYNYPWFHRRLKKVVSSHDYTLYISKKPTLKNSWFTGKFDFISARNVAKVDMLVLARGKSDHMPVRATITY